MHEWIYIGMNIWRGVGCGSSGWSMNDDDTEQAMSKCTVSHGAIFIIVNRSIELWCWLVDGALIVDRSVQTLPGGDELLGRKLHTRMHPKTRFDLECLYRVGRSGKGRQ